MPAASARSSTHSPRDERRSDARSRTTLPCYGASRERATTSAQSSRFGTALHPSTSASKKDGGRSGRCPRIRRSRSSERWVASTTFETACSNGTQPARSSRSASGKARAACTSKSTSEQLVGALKNCKWRVAEPTCGCSSASREPSFGKTESDRTRAARSRPRGGFRPQIYWRIQSAKVGADF